MLTFFLYVALVLDLCFNIDEMLNGLKLTSGKGRVDQLILRVKDIFNKLYDKLVAFRGVDIEVPPSIPLPPPKAGRPKKCRWGIRSGDTNEFWKSLDDQSDLKRNLSTEYHPYVEEFDILG